ncbi:MAG: tetratricopeptide repeat protein [Planctomycetota bacterium]
MIGMLVLLCCALDGDGNRGELGHIDFPTSGAPAAQAAFVRGVLLLHSFEYDDAAEAFREAQQLDPDFAMAYWGEAMTYCHPIWATEDVAAAKAALGRLAPTAVGRTAKAPTEREKGFLAAVEALYADGDWRARYASYSRAMGDLHARFPDDLEIASLYALSLLGTVRGERDIPIYMRAAAVAEEVYQRAPLHPGALHYLIHSYDDPVHAPLGLRMARTYGSVAPAAAHALHMPSHIFVALGMWDDSAAANEASAAAADARVARKKLSIEERGYHSLWWLAYTYLQQGRRAAAHALLERMQQDASQSGSARTRQHLAVMRAEYLVNAEAWGGHEASIVTDTKDLEVSVVAADRFATGMAQVRTGKLDAARKVLSEMRARRGARGEGGERIEPVVGSEHRELLPASAHRLRGARTAAPGGGGDDRGARCSAASRRWRTRRGSAVAP